MSYNDDGLTYSQNIHRKLKKTRTERMCIVGMSPTMSREIRKAFSILVRLRSDGAFLCSECECWQCECLHTIDQRVQKLATEASSFWVSTAWDCRPLAYRDLLLRLWYIHNRLDKGLGWRDSWCPPSEQAQTIWSQVPFMFVGVPVLSLEPRHPMRFPDPSHMGGGRIPVFDLSLQLAAGWLTQNTEIF